MGRPAPRCGAPMRRHSVQSDPDPVCWRPAGHDRRGDTPAARRHLSRQAYENEKRRSQQNRRNWARYGQAA